MAPPADSKQRLDTRKNLACNNHTCSKTVNRFTVDYINHFSTIGRYRIFLTQTFPQCGATCYILPSRAMSQLLNGVNFVYRSVEVY